MIWISNNRVVCRVLGRRDTCSSRRHRVHGSVLFGHFYTGRRPSQYLSWSSKVYAFNCYWVDDVTSYCLIMTEVSSQWETLSRSSFDLLCRSESEIQSMFFRLKNNLDIAVCVYDTCIGTQIFWSSTRFMKNVILNKIMQIIIHVWL